MTSAPPSLTDTLKRCEADLLGVLESIEDRFAEREGEIHAFVAEDGRFDRLRRQAADLLRAYPPGSHRPPLFGLPVGVKDIFHVDGFATHAGSRLPPEELAGEEAASVRRLRRAGALILGKTVTTEFAYFAPGPTRNPRHPDHTPGGSSSGSAAAVGAGLCPLALGTQTIGSIVRPAAFCGIAGFKPTYDRISREGVIPLSPSLDHVGFFTPGVDGAALVASLLCRHWRPAGELPEPKIGIPVGPYLDRLPAETAAAFEGTRKRFEERGLRVASVPAMGDFDEVVARHDLIVAADAARVHRSWFARHRDLYHPRTAELLDKGIAINDAQPEAALAGRDGREKLRRELTAGMDESGIDLWLAPSALGPAPRGLESTGDPVMDLPWTHAGLPALGLPAPAETGRTSGGLPLGVQLVARWHADEKLLAWGARLESMLAADTARVEA